jgi:hypothetical protein
MKRVALLLLFARVAYADAQGSPDALRAPHTLVVHVPPISATPGDPIELEAMLDAPYAEQIAVRYREIGTTEWHDAAFERSSAGGWYATLPGTRATGVEYYIHGRDLAGGEVDHFASADAPHLVRVDATLADRLEQLDHDRLDGHREEVALDVTAHDFGNRYGLADHYVRAELAYTHRLWRALDQITFGFGSISGKTPLMSEPGGEVDAKALRYGFGELRVRLHTSVYADIRASLGASQAGFEGGVRGQLILGKPWRSNVSLGGEYLGDLGGTAWVRLQWDTAPPFLMGAAIVRTDLPGSAIEQTGLMLAYDIAYPIAKRARVKAQVSYGARDGDAQFGGGVGTAIEF